MLFVHVVICSSVEIVYRCAAPELASDFGHFYNWEGVEDLSLSKHMRNQGNFDAIIHFAVKTAPHSDTQVILREMVDNSIRILFMGNSSVYS